MRALAIAATGMSAQQLHVEVIANNMANINTTGFKRSRAEFSDLLYQTERLQGVSNRGRDAIVPEGAQVGLGVRTAAIRTVNEQGTLQATGNQLDLALTGRGWFQVTGPDGDTLYTRAGSFNTSATGQIVTLDGYALVPAMTVPTGAKSINVSESGAVSVSLDGQTAPQQIGQLTISNFANEAGLQALGGNLFKVTEASGAPVNGVPADPGFATVKQGYLESSNVDPVKEITELITAQRSYEMNSKVIQAADEMAKTVSTGLR